MFSISAASSCKREDRKASYIGRLPLSHAFLLKKSADILLRSRNSIASNTVTVGLLIRKLRSLSREQRRVTLSVHSTMNWQDHSDDTNSIDILSDLL